MLGMKPQRTKPISIGQVALAVCSATAGEARTVSQRVLILPFGEFRGLNGLPTDVPFWRATNSGGKKIAAAINARNTATVIDYDHQTLFASKTGVKAVAACWFSKVEWVDGVGLFTTDANWTAAAAAHIEADEFRYISPVFSYHKKTGEVTALINAALTNTPNLDNMADVAALAIQSITIQEEPMDELIEQLRWLLNLPISAGADEVTSELQKLIDKLKGTGEATAANGFDLAAYLAKAETAIAVNSQAAASPASPDPAQYAPIADLQAVQRELNELRTAANAQQVDALINPALESGALLPAQEVWARELGRTNIAALSQFVSTLVAPAAFGGTQTGGKPPAQSTSPAGLTDAELAVCSQMGIEPEAFAKTKAA
ncbi:MAG: hypothetical protein C4516_04320 [Oxalobacter sp.]|nr:MAG: hypothetical protein C4516_04320 [Oxalobacter sp.]